ncbi:MAG: hypothetical protein V3575_03150, partial [Candidatus Absconditabacteria bacterium]
ILFLHTHSFHHSGFAMAQKGVFVDDNEIQEFVEFCKMPLKKSIRLNTNKMSSQDFIQTTKTWGYTLTDPGFIKVDNDSFYIDRDNTDLALGRTFFHQSGFFYIQEIAASLPAKFFEFNENDLVLDISSAPGGKTIQIADYLMKVSKKRPGFVVSNDVNGQRILATAFNINRMGTYNTGLTKFNGFAFGTNLPEVFDHALVDAPCSGEGTGFKSDSALKFWNRKEINKISGTQFQLLVSAIKAVKPGGTIIYSTCTLNPFENERTISKVIEFFGGDIEIENVDLNNKSYGLESHNGEEFFSADHAKKLARFWPHKQKTGGFFICKLKKLASTKSKDKENKLTPKNPFKLENSSSFQKKIINHIEENYGIKIDKSEYHFFGIKDRVYVTSSKFLEIKDYIHFERVGVPIFKNVSEGGLKPLHYFAVIFGNKVTKNYITFDTDTTQKYASLEDVDLKLAIENVTTPKSKYIVIKWNGYGISVGKIINETVKNKYLR